MDYLVTTFYKFLKLEKGDLETLKAALEKKAAILDIWGLTLIAEEGINATIAGTPTQLEEYKNVLRERFGEITFKDSPNNKLPFRRFKIKIKKEIVQLRRPDIQPTGAEPHLSPKEWDQLATEEDVVLIDVRNWYETKLGSFKGAVAPNTISFHQFPKWVKKSNIKKDQKIGIFCTGGIRCEKAAVEMNKQGYENVYQLDGGILNYIEQQPNKNFEGHCFVFDHRVAVGQDLKQSKTYGRCPWCGNGGSIKKSCDKCETSFKICDDCNEQKASTMYCSKKCKSEAR